MNKHATVVMSILLGLCLAAASGCSFLGGQEAEYTYAEPQLSPNGNEVVYASASEAGVDLFVLDLTTNVERQLTFDEYANWSPSWSPDGTRIAFASSRNKNVDIYILDVVTLEVTRVTTHKADDIHPSWGIDGAVYFNSNRSDTWEAYAIDPETLALRKLTSLDAATP